MNSRTSIFFTRLDVVRTKRSLGTSELLLSNSWSLKHILEKEIFYLPLVRRIFVINTTYLPQNTLGSHKIH